MELKEILSKINKKPNDVYEITPFGNTYHFKFPDRQHFNVNNVIIRCEELYVSNTGLEFYFKDHTHGRFVQIDKLSDVEYFYHYL
jgi:pantothenate kinase